VSEHHPSRSLVFLADIALDDAFRPRFFILLERKNDSNGPPSGMLDKVLKLHCGGDFPTRLFFQTDLLLKYPNV